MTNQTQDVNKDQTHISKYQQAKPIKYFTNKFLRGDALKNLKTIPSESIDCVVTSPPYWSLRDYGVKTQIGLEENFDSYLEKLILIFDEIKRVLRPSGTCWVNFGDTYSSKNKDGHRNKSQTNMFDSVTKQATLDKPKTALSIPPKSLCLIPSRFAIKMIERGWILRNEIIWHKPNAMPQSIKDRFTVDFEKVFFFVKSKSYHFKQQYEPLKNPNELKRRHLNPFDTHKYRQNERKSQKPLEKIKQSQREILKKGRRKRCVWTIANGSSISNHYAVFPEKLIETPILAGCPKNGIVLDPFMGSGTTAVVARKLNRNFIGIELNPDYVKLAKNRLKSIITKSS